MTKPATCELCPQTFNLKPVQRRRRSGIRKKGDPAFEKKVRYWCGRCRFAMDGHWRHARKE